jgi:hypothetical protein
MGLSKALGEILDQSLESSSNEISVFLSTISKPVPFEILSLVSLK